MRKSDTSIIHSFNLYSHMFVCVWGGGGGGGGGGGVHFFTAPLSPSEMRNCTGNWKTARIPKS